MSFTLHHGDCLDVLRGMADNSIDSIVTDPPYGLSFMGKKWDYDVPAVEVWAECLRVLKPGGHLLAFAGTRTQHRMAVRIEDAGFEIRDMIAWVYGSGFPKSMDVSKAIDKAAGAEREVLGTSPNWRESKREREASGSMEVRGENAGLLTIPATEAARQWQGWGTALKPALEPITVARKPLAGTVAANVLEWGTGALNIDGCRVATGDKLGGGATSGHTAAHEGYRRPWMDNRDHLARHAEKCAANVIKAEALGRWPANLIHDGSEEVMAGFPETSQQGGPKITDCPSNTFGGGSKDSTFYGDKGSAARFFYTAKASQEDRDAGLHDAPLTPGGSNAKGYTQDVAKGIDRNRPRANHHPTVKPTDLMRYLVRLVTPPGGTALDPFMGSGSTGKATMLEGFRFVGIEREAEYIAIARARIEYAQALKASGAEKLQPATARDAHTVDLFA